MVTIIDGNGAVAGRLAAMVMKRLLKGEEVAVVNADKIVISGHPVRIIERYQSKRTIKNKANPMNSPVWPRRADFFYKKLVSGMAPKKARGRTALKLFRAYVGVPKGMEKAEKIVKTSAELSSQYITLDEICKAL